MIAVSLNVSGGVRLIKPAKHYIHDEEGRKAPGVCGNGSVPLSHSGNVVPRIGIHTYTHWLWRRSHLKVFLFVALAAILFNGAEQFEQFK